MAVGMKAGQLPIWSDHARFILILAMITGLFISRGLLSVSMIAFLAISFAHPRISKQLALFFSTPLLWGMSILFFIPLVSGLWSSDKTVWAEITRIKLPLLFLPLAFAGPFTFKNLQWKATASYFLIVLLLASGWTFYNWLNDINAINEGYLRAKTMKTPLQNDHVRFSWLLSVGVLVAGILSSREWNRNKGLALFAAVTGSWLIIFIHLLSARTGIVSLYLMLIALVVWLIIKRSNLKLIIIILAGLVLLPLASYQFHEGFRNRVNLMKYEYDFFKKSQYIPGSSDSKRIISMKAGMELMMNNPLAGVGFGDIEKTMEGWYDQNYPDMLKEDKIYPGSEYLVYGTGTGLPGILFFILVMILPFFTSVQYRLPWIMLNISMAAGFLFDIGLEVQFGVFCYAFMLLWFWKWLNAENS